MRKVGIAAAWGVPLVTAALMVGTMLIAGPPCQPDECYEGQSGLTLLVLLIGALVLFVWFVVLVLVWLYWAVFIWRKERR